MQTEQQDLREKRLEKLKAKNLFLRERLAALKKENDGLQKSLRNSNKLFHSNPTAILLLQKDKVVAINQIALDQLGYTAEETIGRNFWDFVHPRLKAFIRNLHKKRASGKWVPERYETEMVKKKSETFCCDVWVKKIRYNGRMAFLLNLTPLEERKKREEEILQSKKGEALNTMAKGLSQELQRLHETTAEATRQLRIIPGSENSELEGLEKIESASNETLRIAQKLDTLSQSENDQSNVVLFDLKKTVKDAVALTSSTWKNGAEGWGGKINLKTYLRSELPIRGDPREIQDVIVYMILNAVEAMPDGGDLYLTTEESAGYALIYIQDCGVGISHQIKDRIFDPFFTTKGHESIGLGLSISRAIIQRHNGEIELTSQESQGTIVTIKLPLARQEPKSRSGPIRSKIKNARILVIEDEDILGELLSQVLVSKGYRVVTAVSGLEGLNTLKKKAFHLVIIDSRTPHIHGQLLVREIRKMKRALPIAMITEHERGDTHGSRSAVDLIIHRPVDIDKMLKQISEILILRAGHPVSRV